MNKELINEKPIRDAWINLYNELLNALKTFVQNRGGEVDVEVVYHWYEDEAVNATRVKKLYINDEGELVWVRNSFDYESDYYTDEVCFNDGCWDEEDWEETLRHNDGTTGTVAYLETEIMAEIVSWVNWRFAWNYK